MNMVIAALCIAISGFLLTLCLWHMEAKAAQRHREFRELMLQLTRRNSALFVQEHEAHAATKASPNPKTRGPRTDRVHKKR